MGSGASSNAEKVATGLTKIVNDARSSVKALALEGEHLLTASSKGAPPRDVRRASFVTLGEKGRIKSAKLDEETSSLHADEALKVTIHNDASRRAFMKFLQKSNSGHDHVLNYYFEIDDIKSASNSDVIEKSRILHERYSSYLQTSDESLRPIWKSILDGIKPLIEKAGTMDPEDFIIAILEQCKATQDFIVSTLSPILAKFYQSDIYKEFENAKSHQEGALLRPSGISTAGSHGSTPVTPMPAASTGSAGSAGRGAPPMANMSTQMPNVNTYPKYFKKILVVDDSSVTAKLSVMAMKKNGHEVKIASNGRKCLEMCEVEVFDVVLVDLYMPIMDGFETMTALKATRAIYDGKGQKFPIVIGMSADWDKATEEKAVASGADSFLEKPFSIDKLSVILVKFIPSDAEVDSTPTLIAPGTTTTAAAAPAPAPAAVPA